MAYLAPIHRPSSVRHAIQLSFTNTTSSDLIIAKANRLEIWCPSPSDPSQLIHHSSHTIYGKITLLHSLRPAKSSTDHLFVGTDRYHYFTLSWNSEKRQLCTEKAFNDVADRSARDSQTGDRVHVDPSARFLTLECYEGVINILPIAHAGKGKRKAADHEIGELGLPIPVRIPELFVRDTAFLHKRQGGPRLANPEVVLLWEDTSGGRTRLKVRELEFQPSLKPAEEPGQAELEKSKEVEGEVEMGASHLIALPAPMYGFLVIGETRVTYFDEWDYRQQSSEPLEEPTVWVAWCAIDDQRYVLADDYGRLYLLFVRQNSQGEYVGHKIDLLGETSRASTLVYLDGGRIFVGSHQGDSQIVQISEDKGVEVVQSFANIAPVLDFTVMDMGNRSSDAPVNEFSSGQARIVTGSGAFKDGSLRSVRSGVGLEDLGSIGEMEAPVASLFSLKSGGGVELDDTLVVSFVSHTRVFTFSSDGEVEEVESFHGFRLDDNTLYACSLPDGRAVQVTSSALFLCDADSGMITDTWEPPVAGHTVTAVAADGATVLISLGGAILTLLDLSSPTIRVRAQRQFDSADQVSCITLSPTLPDVCIAGFWKDSLVSFLSLSDLSTLTTENVGEPTSTDTTPAVPRSLVVANIIHGQPPTLFVGLADGNVITYNVTSSHNSPFSNRKSMILGTQQPNFALLPRTSDQTVQNVFATCEHPSLIYGAESRLVYSAVTAETASSVCAFHSAAYPHALALATASGELKLALVDEERTTHVQTLAVHETVRRIAYSSALKVFGLGTVKRTLSAGEEVVESSFRLVEEVALQVVASFAFGKDELVECCARGLLEDGFGGEAERFVVGTAFLDDAEGGAGQVKGRLLVFEVVEGKQLKVVTEMALKGACRCVGIVDGRIVAALVKTVVIYAFEHETASTPFLVKKAAYRTSTAPIDLAITSRPDAPPTIAVTDLMKSVSLLTYTRGRGGAQDLLTETARHFDTLWGTAVAAIDTHSYLAADAEGNLIVLQHDQDGFSDVERRRLRVTSEILLGEMVNRIRRIDVVPTANAVVIPRAFCATVEGGIYLFAVIAPGKQDLLIRLQGKIAEVVESPGNVPFAAYRGFRAGMRGGGDEGPVRFVDGEIVEKFLELDEEVQERVVEGLPGVSGVEEVRGLVEGLRRIH